MRVSAALLVVLFAFSAVLAPVRGYAETDHEDSSASTHQFLMDAIPAIWEQDGHAELAALLRGTWLSSLKAGTIAADANLLLSREHYLAPSDHAGLFGFASAGERAEVEFVVARDAWLQGQREEAMLHLGWSMHMVQDLTVPHHARLTFLDFHASYEDWVLAHQGELPVATTGVYDFGGGMADHYGNISRPFDWVDYAAHASWPRFDQVDGPNGWGDNDYAAVAEDMVPLAERLSAGFLYRMLERLDSGPPVANAGTDREVTVGETVVLNASASWDDIAIHAFEWTLPGNATVAGVEASFQPTTEGAYTAEVSVVDAFGRVGTDTVLITVVSALVQPAPSPQPSPDLQPPVARIEGPPQAFAGERVTFDGRGSTDNGAIAVYEWEFGDGATGQGRIASHTYTAPGDYEVTLWVTDGNGNRAKATTMVHIAAIAGSAVRTDWTWWVVAAALPFILLVVWYRRRKPASRADSPNG